MTEDNSKYRLETPWRWKENKDWLVFPDAVFSDLEMSDCNDTVHGICHQNISLEECLKLCQTHSECKAGYYIASGNGKNSFCVPIQSDYHPDLIPAFRLRNKNIYAPLKHKTVDTFINTRKYPFPPDMANAVFADDSFALQNIKTGNRIKLDQKLDTTQVLFSSDQDSMFLQFLHLRTSLEKIQSWIPVRYGEPIVVNIPGTSLLMTKGYGMTMKWIARILATPQIENTIKIHSVDHSHQKIAFYGDRIYLTYQDVNILVYNEGTNTLDLLHSSYETAKSNGRNVEFRLIPKVEAYYCKNGKCLPVDLEKTETNFEKARYKGYPVTRNPACWDCERKRGKPVFFIVLGIILVIILLVAVLAIKFYRN